MDSWNHVTLERCNLGILQPWNCFRAPGFSAFGRKFEDMGLTCFLAKKNAVSVGFLGMRENAKFGTWCRSHCLRNHVDLNSGDVPHLSTCQKTIKTQTKKMGVCQHPTCFPFFLFSLFSGIWIGEVHPWN